MYKPAMIGGALFAAIAVILGAFGAHALKEILEPHELVTFETGVKYQMYHAFALLVTGMIYKNMPAKTFSFAATCFIIGILLFSGSLYLLTFLKANDMVGLGGFGLLTPIGGVFFIAGWIVLCVGLLQKK